MQQTLQNNTPETPAYNPIEFGLQLTKLFGEQFSWAILRHPRHDVAVLRLGTSNAEDRNDAIMRRITPDGTQLLRPAGENRWQPWTGNEAEGYSAGQIAAQFALLEIARRDSPLTDGKGYLFNGRPLEPFFALQPMRPQTVVRAIDVDALTASIR